MLVTKGATWDYPFSIKPDKKLDISDVMSLYRDHYEGTEFDLTSSEGFFSSPEFSGSRV